MSAIGNVIAFNGPLRPEAVVGAFNDNARDLWAWAYAEVPATFHPRHALERWYRYHLYEDGSINLLREAAALFPGRHDLRSFTSDPAGVLSVIGTVGVTPIGDAIAIDVRAPSFRRGMVRRIVAALLSYARGDVGLAEIRRALAGAKRDFGSVPPEPLFLMDVLYDFPFQIVRSPKARDEWRALGIDAALRLRWLRFLQDAVVPELPQ